MSRPHNSAEILVDAISDPTGTAVLDDDGWTALLTIARAEQLIGTLADRLALVEKPPSVAAIMQDADKNAEYQRKTALWEADRARAALAQYGGRVVLMKGTAYHAADLPSSRGRHVGDLDIMVAEDDLREVERALIAAGWEWVKEDEYDDAYYRDYMHELPPLIHKERDRMADVHHTILPKTAKPTPDAAGMLANAVPTENGYLVFAPADMVIHNVAHLFADGDLAGGLRNLWDFHCLIGDFGAEASFWGDLDKRARHHQLLDEVKRAAIISTHLYGTKIPTPWFRMPSFTDRLFIRCMLARNGRGQRTRKFTRLAFYIRSHWLRMPPLMLARHLWTKWRKGHKPTN